MPLEEKATRKELTNIFAGPLKDFLTLNILITCDASF